MSRASIARAMLCVSALSVPSAVSAYTPSESKWNPATLPISYRVNTASAPSSIGAAGALSAVQGGFASWAAPVCSAWRTNYAGTSTLARANQRDRSNDILWISGAWPAELGSVSVTIGVTTPVWTVGGYYFDADIQFNNVGFTWSMGGARGTVDTQSIATHEEGHFLGLDHSPLTSAVMYAAYSGGDRSRLSSDDIAGVCFLYPTGVAVPDAGVSTPDAGSSADPCSRYTSCAGCTPVNNCGWCGATGQCVTSRSTGPVAGACASGFAWTTDMCTTTPVRDSGTVAPTDAGSTSTDPCDRFSASCGACTPIGGCGWCGATNRCMYGASTGPTRSTCGSGWAWNPGDCAASMGTASFGEPCTRTTDCASGGPCVGPRGATTGVCTRVCVDDCSCPRGYTCSGTTSVGTVCLAGGTNSCVADAGTTPPVDVPVTPRDVPVTPRDVPVTPRDVPTGSDVQEPTDLGNVMPLDDAGMKTGDDAAVVDAGNAFVPAPEPSGCGCRTSATDTGRQGWMGLMALSLLSLRYRRRARRAL